MGPRDITTLKGKTKKISFIDESIKVKAGVPSPVIYNKDVVWCGSETNTAAKKG